MRVIRKFRKRLNSLYQESVRVNYVKKNTTRELSYSYPCCNMLISDDLFQFKNNI